MLLQNTYDEFAEEYAAMVSSRDEGNLSRDALAGNFFDVIGDIKGLRALDAGCGEGFVARMLRARGATVTGIDISPNLVEKAKSKSEKSIEYMVADLSAPLPQFEGYFDLVASYLVLNDVPDYKGFISTLGAVMKPGGRAVLSLNNPYSAVLRGKADTYFDSGAVRIYRTMAKAGVKVYHYHRTMAEYIKAFVDCGFLLRTLREAAPGPEDPEERRTGWNQVPFLIVTEFVKLNS